MTKKKLIFCLLFFIGILGMFLVCRIIFNKPKIEYKINNHDNLWNVYDHNIKIIETNMNEITSANENYIWWELSDFAIVDSEYQSVLNSLVADIRVCYLELTDSNINTQGNDILNYRKKTKISEEELKKLIMNMSAESCIYRFSKYKSLLISSDTNRRENVLNLTKQMDKIAFSVVFDDTNISFNELLEYKVLQTNILSDMSYWLKQEYYKLK